MHRGSRKKPVSPCAKNRGERGASACVFVACRELFFPPVVTAGHTHTTEMDCVCASAVRAVSREKHRKNVGDTVHTACPKAPQRKSPKEVCGQAGDFAAALTRVYLRGIGSWLRMRPCPCRHTHTPRPQSRIGRNFFVRQKKDPFACVCRLAEDNTGSFSFRCFFVCCLSGFLWRGTNKPGLSGWVGSCVCPVNDRYSSQPVCERRLVRSCARLVLDRGQGVQSGMCLPIHVRTGRRA